MEDFPSFFNDESAMRMFTRLSAQDKQDILNLPDEKRIQFIRTLFLLRWRTAMGIQTEMAQSPNLLGTPVSQEDFDVKFDGSTELGLVIIPNSKES